MKTDAVVLDRGFRTGVVLCWIFVCLALFSSQFALAEARLTAVQIFGQAAELLDKAKGFTVEVEKEFDVILDDGAKVQYSGAADVFYEEDVGLFIDYGDDISAKKFWYDGESVTLLDLLANVYVAVPFKGTVSEVLERIEERHDLRLPLAPLMKKNLAKEFDAAVVKARYLGIHDVDGVSCHHLLFRGKQEDWQIWIDAAKQPLIRKMVVNFREIEGSPQQTVYLNEWQLDPELTAETFASVIPDDAIRTEFVAREGAQ